MLTAWDQGRKIGPPQIAPEAPPEVDSVSVNVALESYHAWIAKWKIAAELFLHEIREKSWYPQAYCAVNGFWRHLDTHASQNAGRSYAEIVDGYFALPIYAQSTERMYRRWIRRVFDIMEASQ